MRLPAGMWDCSHSFLVSFFPRVRTRIQFLVDGIFFWVMIPLPVVGAPPLSTHSTRDGREVRRVELLNLPPCSSLEFIS